MLHLVNLEDSLPFYMDQNQKIFRNSLAPVQIFNAIPEYFLLISRYMSCSHKIEENHLEKEEISKCQE